MKKVLLILLLPALIYSEIGKVKFSTYLDIDQPFGLAIKNNILLIADRSAGNLHRFSLKNRKLLSSTPLPCSHPWGIAADSKGLWISDRENSRLLHFNINKNIVDSVLSEVETDASGLAWDGNCLWASSRNKFLKLDPTDGTELQTFSGPGRDTTAIFFDGQYLWLSERYGDKIVCATTEGDIFAVLPSPGPYPAGLCRQDDTLWILDFEEKKLYALDISFNSQPFYPGKPHRRKLNFKHTLYNQGPSDDVIGKIYICLGKEDYHQKILKPIMFSTSAVKYLTDKWHQKYAFVEKNIPALKSLELGFQVNLETRDLNYFILPEWVKPLESIPANIRKKYLVDGHKLKLTDPFIKKLVKKIIKKETNPFWIAFKIHQYLHVNMEYKYSGGWNAAPTILKRGNGSCSEFTFSFIALARAAGLPARYEAGISLRGDDGSIDRVYHRWVQVYLPPFGWIPVDPSRGKPATAMQVAENFGALSHRHFITTHSGGDSPYLGWTYNSHSSYQFSGQAIIKTSSEAKWYPLKKNQ